MNGGYDDDILEGGTGNDVLIGGSGADEFRFDLGAEVGTVDEIRDFVDGVDQLRFVDAGSGLYTDIGVYDAALANPAWNGALVWTTDNAANNHFVYVENVDVTLLTISFDSSGDILIA